MRIKGCHYRTIWVAGDGRTVEAIDQTKLPHAFEIKHLRTVQDAAEAIVAMVVRGAPLIGVAASYGICLAMREDPTDEGLAEAVALLGRTRPTAVNLKWALARMARHLSSHLPEERLDVAYEEAARIADEDVENCHAIGLHGARIIREVHRRTDRPVNVLTHCNAGWLATVDWGTALAPIYAAHDAGIPVHVWVDETRPRLQGAALTAFELGAHGVPYCIVADNAGGHLMQRGKVDLCIVGSDRTTASGDVANKIGTYLKALAAWDNGVPFYAALPVSTIDWNLDDGKKIPIEERAQKEVTCVTGRAENGIITSVMIAPPHSRAANPAFDVTPARLVTGIITERGVAHASREGLLGLYPERNAA
jgi:methylthioribose-1-phosphate isomerase